LNILLLLAAAVLELVGVVVMVRVAAGAALVVC
jgi:hypothetical protein